MNEKAVPERAQSPVEKPKVSATPSAPTTPASDLPPIAADADDLRVIKQVVDDAASVGGALWLSYLFVLFYLAVATGAVTHADLFFENPVKLPFLNIELPLLAFFFIAPILFLVVHAYTLVHLVMLTDKAKRYHQALYDQIGDKDGLSEQASKKRKSIRDGLRRQLPSNIFVQFLVGPADLRRSAFGWLLRAVAWATLVIAPMLVLLLMQVQFLPFHNSFITWTHRIVLLLDLGLIWWLWRAILSGREADCHRGWASSAWTGLGVLASASAFVFSWTTATFPGERQENFLANWDKLGVMISLHNWVFESPLDETTHRRWLPFSSTLLLTGLNVYEGLNIDDPKKVEWRDFVFLARGRDLKGAIFSLANLPKVDFTGANLQGASLGGANLLAASLDDAQLQGASLGETQLQGASLRGAHLEGAWLVSAHLEGALLDWAWLVGASLDAAHLEGASLYRAQLDGASLKQAQLQGASLRRAEIYATDLSNSLLWRTNLPNGNSFIDLGSRTQAVRLENTPSELDPWLPLAQDKAGKLYQALLRTIESLPSGSLRDRALDRIQHLDCSNPDPTLASCDSSRPPPPEAVNWRKLVEDNRVGGKAYVAALAEALKSAICWGQDRDHVDVLRGLLGNRRLDDVGPEAPALIQFILSKDCRVFASLTSADKANLLEKKEYMASYWRP